MDAGLSAALKKAIDVLDALELPYAVVGGLAVSAWAVPRATRDADIWVQLRDRHEELERSLRAAGFHVPAMREELQRFGVFRSKSPGGVFVDIFDAVGPLGDEIIARRTRGAIGATPVFLATAEDVAVLKAFSDRPRDFDDLVHLMALPTLDVHHVRRWARDLDSSVGTNEVSARVDSALAATKR